MRRLYFAGGLCALIALLAAQPVLAAKDAPSSPKFCELSNATVDLEAAPPTVLLEGSFCKTGNEPSVWISKDGTPTPVGVLGSGDTSILLDATGFEFVQDARAWVVCGTGALASGCTMDLAVNKADADADPTNEIQSLSHTSGEICLSDDGCVPDEVEDDDADPGNELQSISKSGSTVTLSKGGGSFEDDVEDADADQTNELQTLQFTPDTGELSISQGNTVTITRPTLEVLYVPGVWGSDVVPSGRCSAVSEAVCPSSHPVAMGGSCRFDYNNRNANSDSQLREGRTEPGKHLCFIESTDFGVGPPANLVCATLAFVTCTR